MLPPFRRLAVVAALLLLSGALSGCIIQDESGSHSWCWLHPYACH